MDIHRRLIGAAGVAALIAFLLSGCEQQTPGAVKDEAMKVGRTGDTFLAADEDYFADLDGGYRRATDPQSGRSTSTQPGAATPGSRGPAATTASGTIWPTTPSALSTS